uniref:calcium/sodium antiporter n=1 Tax=Rubrobacter aplysinae TaxID=909625 RepID=UPI003899A74C
MLAVVGLVALPCGAELLVRGASRLAGVFGVSPLVVGLTVVAFGTSAPEAAVGVQSVLTGSADVALGNAIGSNVLNVLLVLGLSAAITPLVVSSRLVRLDVPIMIGVSFLLLVLCLNGELGRPDGLILFTGIAVYTFHAIRRGRREGGEEPRRNGRAETAGMLLQALYAAAGLFLLVLGARWLVDGAVAVAEAAGLSQLVIGLTVVAVGTSLPEIATSVAAAFRGEREMAVGNIVGSCIFNVLFVLGLAGLVAPDGIGVSSAVLGFDLPVMIATAVACLPIFFTGLEISRWEGFLFLGYYVAYTLYLILAATNHDALPAFSAVMMALVIPLTLVALLVPFVRALRGRAARRKTS